MDGYVITKGSPLAAVPAPTERYAAHLHTGEGFVAADDLGQIRHLGEWMEPQAFWWWRAAPKRAVGTGEEVFGLISVDLVADLAPILSAATGVKLSPALAERFGVGATDLALVETQGAHIPLAVWRGRVKAFRDARTRVLA
jgi:hypothetical protein